MSNRTESTRASLSSSQLFGFNAGSRATMARRGSKAPASRAELDENQILDTLNAVQTAAAVEAPVANEQPAPTEAA